MPDKLQQTILESVSSIPIPPLPQVLVRFLSLAETERSSLADLTALVALDPAFAAQILTIASSPPYRQENAVISLERAVASIGIPLLRTLATVMAVQDFHTQTSVDRNLDYSGFWHHSLRVASLARSLAAAVGYQDAEEAYLSGLLHDIGQLLLVGGVGEFCGSLLGSNGPETGLAGITQTIKSIDASEVGARLVDSWQLSSFMADAVRFHQFPAEQIKAADMLCRIVWSAHQLGCVAGDVEASAELYPAIQPIPAILDIDLVTIVNACRLPQSWVAERAASLGVQIHRSATDLHDHKFIYPYVSLPKPVVGEVARHQLEAIVRIKAVMQPLQNSLIALPNEADLYDMLRETARLLLGLQRPVFLVTRPDRPVLAVGACAGQHPLLARLEIALEPCQSLAASALQTQKPCSSFDDEGRAVTFLADIQLARILGCKGLLCIPLSTASAQLGVMVFGLNGDQYASKRGQLEWITSFARLAANSLQSFRDLRQSDLRLTTELTSHFEHKARKIIHEAANPLCIINSYLQIFAEKLGDATEVQQELTILKEEIARVERIVRGLNDTVEQPLPVETVNVNALIEGMLALYGESLFETRGINIDKQLASGLPLARADRDSLKQILFNLWKNSSEAMPAGGSFRISTHDTWQDSACSSVEVRLSDTGPGIPLEIKERLFQHLVPERSPTGSGVGLSIVAALVEKLGGRISCDSSPGQGTTFTIRLTQAQKEMT